MVELDLRAVDAAQAPLPQPQAEIDIVVVDGESLVEPLDRFEVGPPHHHAGPRHREVVAVARGREEVAGVFPRVGAAGMIGRRVDHRDADMLQLTGLEQELGADRADAGDLQKRQHRLDPVGADDLDVVVEEDQHRARGRTAPEIHLGGDVEDRLVPGDGAGIVPLQRFFRRWPQVAVIDRHDLDRLVGGPLADAGEASGQEIDGAAADLAVAPGGGDHDRDQGPLLARPAQVEAAGKGGGAHAREPAGAPRPVLQCPDRGGDHVALVVHGLGGRAGDCAPVVEHFGHVVHAGDVLGVAQDEIVILRALAFRPEGADAGNDIHPVERQMGRVHAGFQRLGRPIRLEERLVALAAHRDLVLVRVEEIDLRIRVQGGNERVERVRRDRVVVVDQREPVAGGQGESIVARRDDAAVLRSPMQPHPRLLRRQRVQHRRDMGRARRVVAEAQLPIGIGLRPDAGKRRLQIGFGRVVDRHDDGDARPHAKARDRRPHRLQARQGRALDRLDPGGVGGRRRARPGAVPECPPKGGRRATDGEAREAPEQGPAPPLLFRQPRQQPAGDGERRGGAAQRFERRPREPEPPARGERIEPQAPHPARQAHEVVDPPVLP